jgi:hypothetical protein
MKADIDVTKEWIKLWLGIALAVFGMGIVLFSLIVPPAGAIHATVITTFGTILGFVGAIFGIDSNTKIKMHEQDVDYELKSEQQRQEFSLRERELDSKMRMFEQRMERKLNNKEDLE